MLALSFLQLLVLGLDRGRVSVLGLSGPMAASLAGKPIRRLWPNVRWSFLRSVVAVKFAMDACLKEGAAHGTSSSASPLTEEPDAPFFHKVPDEESKEA